MTEIEFKGLKELCVNNKIPVPTSDDFSLMDFLVSLHPVTSKLLVEKGKVDYVISKLDNDSDEC